MHQLTLTAAENTAINPVLAEVAAEYATIEDEALVRQASVLAGALPARLLTFLEEFRLSEPAALCLVSGLAVDEQRIGPTPKHWRDRPAGAATFPQEIFFLLLAARLGDVFGWGTQQDGRIMHDVLPIRGHEHHEIGSNSLQHLSWHTEDAFHPCRGDYVALMCLKNPDGAETMVSAGPDVDWSSIDVEALFAPDFTIMPDNSHQPQDAAGSSGDPELDRLRRRSFALIAAWNEQPDPRPLLFGDHGDPYLALDPYHMDPAAWSERSQLAFKQLCAELEANMRDLVLQPGDVVFIDNFRAVHGRKSFVPRYDGTDRWLKRLNITRNLRGSRAWRLAADSRVIY